MLAAPGLYSQNPHKMKAECIQFDQKGMSFDESILLDVISSEEDKNFTCEDLRQDSAKLKKFLSDNGYILANVTHKVDCNFPGSKKIVFNIAGNKIFTWDSVFVNVDKIGDSSKIKCPDVSSDSLKNLDSYLEIFKDTLAERFRRKTVNYIRDSVISLIGLLIDVYQNSGFRYFGLKDDTGTIVKIDEKEGSASVYLNFYCSPQRDCFKDLTIKSNKDIDISLCERNKLLRKFEEAITFKKGDVYDKKKLLLTKENLTKYAIVKNVSFRTDSLSEIIDIKLNEKNDYSLFIKGLYSDSRYYVGGGLSWLNRNISFFESPGSLTIAPQILYNNTENFIAGLTSTFYNPFVFNMNTNLTSLLSFVYNVRNKETYYSINQSVIVDWNKFHIFFFKKTAGGISNDLLFNVYAASDNIVNSSNSPYLNSSILWSMAFDTRNNIYFPSEGGFSSASFSLTGWLPGILKIFDFTPFYYSRYLKIYLEEKYFINLDPDNRRTIFGMCFKTGNITSFLGSEKVIQVLSYYNFFSGGGNSLRGWEAQTNGILNDTYDGGQFLLEGSFELRYILNPNANGFWKTLCTTVFLDYGNVWEEINDFRSDQIALATGFGLQSLMKNGPLRIDFGFQLYNPTQADGNKWLFNSVKNKFAINFSLEQAF